MASENGPTRELGGSDGEKPDLIQSGAAERILGDHEGAFDAVREAFPPPHEIVFTDTDAARAVRFIEACEERR